jgi:hypothetical protein
MDRRTFVAGSLGLLAAPLAHAADSASSLIQAVGSDGSRGRPSASSTEMRGGKRTVFRRWQLSSSRSVWMSSSRWTHAGCETSHPYDPHCYGGLGESGRGGIG